MNPMMSLVPLGDQAALAYFMDEAAGLRFAEAVRRAIAPWLVDVVQAYTSVAVFFDLDRTRFAVVADWLGRLDITAGVSSESRLHRIPCCYDFPLDLDRVVQHT